MKGQLKFTLERTILVLMGAILYTFGVSWFLIPAKLFTAGFAGVSLMLADGLNVLGFTINYGIILLLMNIPTFYMAFKYIGKNFAIYSVVSVASLSLISLWIPEVVITNDRLLSSVVGGVLIGMAIVLTLRAGASTGGTDIVSVAMSLKNDKPIGQYVFLLNGAIILVAGLFNGIETALYTLVNVYVMSEVINRYHVRFAKQTVTIITVHPDILIEEIHKRIIRGITVIDAKGAYTQEQRWMLYTVITNYELAIVRDVINEFDPTAFVNVGDSKDVIGYFLKTKMD